VYSAHHESHWPFSLDLTKRFGREFGVANLTQMRKLYQLRPVPQIVQTASEKFTGLAERPDLPKNLPLYPGPITSACCPWTSL